MSRWSYKEALLCASVLAALIDGTSSFATPGSLLQKARLGLEGNLVCEALSGESTCAFDQSCSCDAPHHSLNLPSASSDFSCQGLGASVFLGSSALAVDGAARDRDLIKLQVGLKGLNKLLDNWEEETTLCNYAEVTRELLERKNKDKLLEAAKTNALFNKDVSMVVKCKRNPVPVRESMGFEDVEHPLYRADKTIKRLRTKADPDKIEDYVEAEEKWQEIYASADAMSYGSKMRSSALGEFKKGEAEEGDKSFLESERRELTKARDTLKTIVEALGG